MYKKRYLTNTLCYVGVNDRTKHLFENMWPLPYGVSYNSYLILDKKTALIDTVDCCYSEEFIKNIEATLDGRPLDYLIVNHMEPDHSGSIAALLRIYPNVTLVGNAKTFNMIEGFYGNLTSNRLEVREKEMLSLGMHNLCFYTAPMVHWPEVMFTYDETDKILFSADAFGCYGALNGGITDTQMNTDWYWDEMERYYANIVGKYGNPVQKALCKLADVEIKMICSTHGPVWIENIPKVVATYDRMSRYEGMEGVTIVYGSMYGNTAAMAESLANALAEQGVRNIAVHNVSVSHPSYILRDLFRYKGIIIGSPTYCGSLYPEIESLLEKIKIRDLKNRSYACFGSFSWAGMAAKSLLAFGESMKWQIVGEPVENKMSLQAEKQVLLEKLAEDMAKAIKPSCNN